jgi:hypothetical protein
LHQRAQVVFQILAQGRLQRGGLTGDARLPRGADALGDFGRAHRHLARGRQHGILDLLDGTLGGRLEQAQAGDFVAPELDAHGQLRAHREHIHDSAAPREASGQAHRLLVLVAVFGESAQQRVGRDLA